MEIEEQILFHTQGRDLLPLCLSSRHYYDLCKSESFWRRKTLHEGLPLPLEKPTNIREWVRWYLDAREVRGFLATLGSNVSILSLTLNRVHNPDIIMLPGIDNGLIRKVWEATDEPHSSGGSTIVSRMGLFIEDDRPYYYLLGTYSLPRPKVLSGLLKEYEKVEVVYPLTWYELEDLLSRLLYYKVIPSLKKGTVLA